MLKSEIENYLLSVEMKQSKIESYINGLPFELELLDVLGVVHDLGLIKGYVTVSSNNVTKEIAFSMCETTPTDKAIRYLNMQLIENFMIGGALV